MAAPANPIRPHGSPSPQPGQPPKQGVDDQGRKVTYDTEEYRGETYRSETTHTKLNGWDRAARVIAAPLAALAGAAAVVGGSSVDTKYWKEYFTESIADGNFGTTKRNDKVELTTEASMKKYDVDITDSTAIQKEIETARDQGRLLRHNHHQYVLLKNSAAIIIPDGKPEKASVRTFWNRDDGKNFENSDTLERVVQCFLLGYDALEKSGGHLDDTLVFDLDCKTVRGFYNKPDANKHLDSLSFADKYYEVDGTVMDSMKAKWDPEKTESKNPLHGDKVESGKRKRDDDDEGAPKVKRNPRESRVPPQPVYGTAQPVYGSAGKPTMVDPATMPQPAGTDDDPIELDTDQARTARGDPW